MPFKTNGGGTIGIGNVFRLFLVSDPLISGITKGTSGFVAEGGLESRVIERGSIHDRYQ